MDYTLNPEAAKQADNMFSRIEEKGKYLGTLTRAEQIVSKKGSKGVDFSFKTDTGATADYLTVWTHNGEGKQLQGFNLLMAIMTCLQLRGIKPAPGKVTRYDFDTKKEVTEDGTVFPDLHKPIGVLLETEDYEKKDGSIGTRTARTDAQGRMRCNLSKIGRAHV